jgi:hypothetical protein
MNNDQQLIDTLNAKRAMLGEYVIRMDLFLGDDDPVNAYLNAQFEQCEAEIERLERTLAVREEARQMRVA